MKKVVTFLFFFNFIFFLNASDLVIVNKTKTPLFEVYIVADQPDFSRQDWGDDLIPFDILMPNDYVTIPWDQGVSKKVNLRFVGEEGSIYQKYSVDISNRQKILVSSEDNLLFASNQDLHFTVVNLTGQVITGLYITTESHSSWGDNLIISSLLKGESADISLPNDQGDTFFDLRYETLETTYIKKGILLSEDARIVLKEIDD